jgi:hypothetical protein
MAGPAGGSALASTRDTALVLGVTALILAGQWVLRNSTLEQVADRVPWWARSALLLFLLLSLILARGDDRAFIYFQF